MYSNTSDKVETETWVRLITSDNCIQCRCDWQCGRITGRKNNPSNTHHHKRYNCGHSWQKNKVTSGRWKTSMCAQHKISAGYTPPRPCTHCLTTNDHSTEYCHLRQRLLRGLPIVSRGAPDICATGITRCSGPSPPSDGQSEYLVSIFSMWLIPHPRRPEKNNNAELR